MLLAYKANVPPTYEDGYEDCIDISNKFIEMQLKKNDISSIKGASEVINNIILYFFYLKLFFNKGE